jgi:hypothetical protein
MSCVTSLCSNAAMKCQEQQVFSVILSVSSRSQLQRAGGIIGIMP